MTAARNTYDMFKSKGVDVLIADELSGFALVSGAVLGGSVAAVSAVIASVLFMDYVIIASRIRLGLIVANSLPCRPYLASRALLLEVVWFLS